MRDPNSTEDPETTILKQADSTPISNTFFSSKGKQNLPNITSSAVSIIRNVIPSSGPGVISGLALSTQHNEKIDSSSSTSARLFNRQGWEEGIFESLGSNDNSEGCH